jgi:UDPglucose 6-dehydrogenase
MLDHVIIVEKSTVPIGTAEMISKIIREMSVKENISKYIITSNPEFLAEGTAVKDLMKPDRVVIGHRPEQQIDRLIDLYHYVPKDKIIVTNQYSAELSKLVNNCFLAQRISSINSISIICE